MAQGLRLAERLSAADTQRPVFLSPPPRHVAKKVNARSPVVEPWACLGHLSGVCRGFRTIYIGT